MRSWSYLRSPHCTGKTGVLQNRPTPSAHARALRITTGICTQRAAIDHNGDAIDFKPVVKLFTPDAQCTWLLTELHADGVAFGLCDLGMGEPELGYVSLMEICAVRGKLGLPIERDEQFEANKTISAYAEDARVHRCIVT
jgi:hypothetical protein